MEFIVIGEERATSPGMSFGSNGVIVPTTIAKKIIEKVSELSPIYEKVEKFHTKGTLEIPVYETDSEKYLLAFTLNVMESIQNEYGSLSNWSELIQNAKEPNIKALKFFITESINEGIDIENDRINGNRAFITSSKAGRLLTKIGLQKVANTITKMIAESMPQDETSKNVKSSQKN